MVNELILIAAQCNYLYYIANTRDKIYTFDGVQVNKLLHRSPKSESKIVCVCIL